MLILYPARIDDEDPGYEEDFWEQVNRRTGSNEQLRADRWFRDDPAQEASRDLWGIRCHIWERAKKRSLITHRLAGGGNHNLGYDALMWESILHGNCGEYGDYRVMSVLPDKLARYLFEYDCDSYTSHNLPALPEDRRDIDVHSLMNPQQVNSHNIHNLCCVHNIHNTHNCRSGASWTLSWSSLLRVRMGISDCSQLFSLDTKNTQENSAFCPGHSHQRN